MRPSTILLLSSLFASTASWAGALSLGYTPVPAEGSDPALLVSASKDIASLQVVIEAGDQTYRFNASNVGSGEQKRFEWKRDTAVTTATAHVLAEFADSSEEEMVLPLELSYGGGLKVDLSKATADLKERTLTVEVTGHVDHAEIVAFGSHKSELSRGTVPIGAGPGSIAVPWTGSASEVVLLDVTLHNDGGWAGFTYSPWFLDIPHDDVHFESNEAVIPESEEHKVQATLEQLHDVIDKYGSVVPVKLYIAGCTDTVGSASHNLDLSRRRAKAIASWLRSHGYNHPIYYYGFGETLLAVGTGDGVDNANNRRALYMVGANPPPPSTGIPQVGWIAL